MPERDEPMPTSELDEEGVPDHVGPLPAKRQTGDAQEGVAPPGDTPAGTDDVATTARGQVEGDSFDESVARENPDVGVDESGREEHRGEGHRAGRVVEPSGEGAGPDTEKDEVGDERPDDGSAYSDEEGAVRAREAGS